MSMGRRCTWRKLNGKNQRSKVKRWDQSESASHRSEDQLSLFLPFLQLDNAADVLMIPLTLVLSWLKMLLLRLIDECSKELHFILN